MSPSVYICLQALVDEFQKTTTSTRNIQTIEDMQNFVEGFSEFSAAQRNAGKHVTLMGELSAAVEGRGLMHISSVSRLCNLFASCEAC